MFDSGKICDLLISGFYILRSKPRSAILTTLFFAFSAPIVSLAQAAGANSGEVSGEQTKPLAVYKKNQLADISDDGKYLLFFQTKTPFRRYSKPLDGGPATAEQPPVDDDLLRVVESETGREIARRGIADFPSALQFIPGTKQIFYQEFRKARPARFVPKIWNYESGATRQCPEIEKSFRSAGFIDAASAYGAIDDDDKNLGSLFYLLVFDLKTFEPVRRIEILGHGTIAVSPDGRLVAASYKSEKKVFGGTAGQSHVVIYELATGKQIRKISLPPLKESRKDSFQAEIKGIMFTNDGKRLLTGTSETFVWDVGDL